jgi:hypothetical protein
VQREASSGKNLWLKKDDQCATNAESRRLSTNQQARLGVIQYEFESVVVISGNKPSQAGGARGDEGCAPNRRLSGNRFSQRGREIDASITSGADACVARDK